MDSLIEDACDRHACESGFSLIFVEVQKNIFILIVQPDLALFSVLDVNVDFVVWELYVLSRIITGRFR